MRPKIPLQIDIEVLVKNKRCCCICKTDGPRKKVQIHHIDGDKSNNDPLNLAVLCLDHHSEADIGLVPGKQGAGRKLTPQEVKRHKELWENRNEKEIGIAVREPIEFLSDGFETIENWIASTKSSNDQGADYRDIILKGDSIGILQFDIIPKTPFWRAGFKLSDPDGSIFPLRSNNSLLFHLGSAPQNNFFGITAYLNGKHVDSVNKVLPFSSDVRLNVKFDVNKNNFIKCYVNGVVEYEPNRRMNHRIFKKVYLVAWGDENDYGVEFEDINLKKR